MNGRMKNAYGKVGQVVWWVNEYGQTFRGRITWGGWVRGEWLITVEREDVEEGSVHRTAIYNPNDFVRSALFDIPKDIPVVA